MARYRVNLITYLCPRITLQTPVFVGWDSSVGKATTLGAGRPEMESRWVRDFRTRPDRPWDPPSLLYNRYRVFPGGKATGAWH